MIFLNKISDNELSIMNFLWNYSPVPCSIIINNINLSEKSTYRFLR